MIGRRKGGRWAPGGTGLACATVIAALAAGPSCGRCGGDEERQKRQERVPSPPVRDVGPRASGAHRPASNVATRTYSIAAARRALWPVVDRETPYSDPTPAEAVRFRQLVGELISLRGGQPDRARSAEALAAGLGLRLERWHVAGRRYWVLTEGDDIPRGVGSYAFRIGERTRPMTILQVPHAYYELRLDAVVSQLFFAGDGAQMLFTNSMHRHQDATDRAEVEHPADASHNPEHWFQLATEAGLEAAPDPIVVQLHGFAESPDDVLSDTYAIVSAGEEPASPLAEGLTIELRERFGRGALLFPDDTGRLGGTTNVQGDLVRERAGAAFLHVELGRRFRERLAGDPAEATRFGDAIDAALASEGSE